MDIPSLVTAISTVVLAAITLYYVILTRIMLKRMYVSDVAIFFKNQTLNVQQAHYDIHFCIENVGTHTVRKVKFDVEPPSFKPGHVAIKDIDWVKNGIETLKPDDMKSCSILNNIGVTAYAHFSLKKALSELRPEPTEVTIKMEYEDIFKKKHKFEFSLDLCNVDIYE